MVIVLQISLKIYLHEAILVTIEVAVYRDTSKSVLKIPPYIVAVLLYIPIYSNFVAVYYDLLYKLL